jgi:uncharacterized protein (DUF1501 family)
MTSRRDFLKSTSALGFAGTLSAASALQLGFMRQATAATFNDYKALVCVLLAGGNDSFNMLLPDDDDQFSTYQQIRSDLALPRNEILPLSGTVGGRAYAVHPGMSGVQSLYAAGELAFIPNVGPLVEYVTAADVAAGAPVPLGVFSHSDQIQTWQTAVANERIAQGWGGRLADVLQDANPANGISMNISLSGTNVFQSGTQVSPYSIDLTDEGAPGVGSYDDPTEFGRLRKRMIDDLLAVPHTNLLRREYTRRLRGAIDARAIFVEALTNGQVFDAPFSNNPFSQSLRQVARVIAARSGLGAVRQTFFITVGGWDHHDDVLNNQADMLPGISVGLQEFRDALVELNVFDAVTTFTTSDFGRTLTSNGKGSDHGWGGHHMVMGGSVNGGQFYGSYPELAPDSPLDVGRGIYVPTTSVDEYFVDLARWYGLADSDLESVLPNVGTFYNTQSGVPALGIFG